MVQGGIDLTVGDVDRAGGTRRWVGVGLMDQAGQWPEETQPKLDQQHAKFQSDRRQAVASALADAFDETFGAELGQVVAQLAEAVAVADKAMASDDACVQLAGRPVTDEPAWMEQRLQQTDHSVVMQLE